jgi:nucleotide-binding universal stress UspA family protein
MTDAFPTPVLLATDGSEDAALAARVAVELCRKAGSELQVVHVGQGISEYAAHFASPERYSFVVADEARELLDEQVKSINRAGGLVAAAYLELGSPAERIVELAEELEAGLIVMGSRGLGPVERLVLGSVAEGVVHGAPCPVLVVRGGEGAWPPAAVVVGDDSSRASKEAGVLGARVGKLFGASTLLVRSYPKIPGCTDEVGEAAARQAEDRSRQAEEVLEERASELEGLLGRRPRTKVTVGDAAAFILKEARRARPALIGVGCRGLGASGRARSDAMTLGSVSTKVLRAAEGPVLVYPPQSRRSVEETV